MTDVLPGARYFLWKIWVGIARVCLKEAPKAERCVARPKGWKIGAWLVKAEESLRSRTHDRRALIVKESRSSVPCDPLRAAMALVGGALTHEAIGHPWELYWPPSLGVKFRVALTKQG
jgi:hypothetical protein